MSNMLMLMNQVISEKILCPTTHNKKKLFSMLVMSENQKSLKPNPRKRGYGEKYKNAFNQFKTHTKEIKNKIIKEKLIRQLCHNQKTKSKINKSSVIHFKTSVSEFYFSGNDKSKLKYSSSQPRSSISIKISRIKLTGQLEISIKKILTYALRAFKYNYLNRTKFKPFPLLPSKHINKLARGEPKYLDHNHSYISSSELTNTKELDNSPRHSGLLLSLIHI